MKILIIEDELGLQRSIAQYLMSEGNLCSIASTYAKALERLGTYEYDCILLDLNLPDGEGLQLLSYLKKMNRKEGVIIISARNSIDDKIEGLSLGADDYLIKPFHLSELNARIVAVVRRKSANGERHIEFNEIRIDLDAKEVLINSKVVYMTKKEFDLLLYFISNKGKVITKSAAVEHIWGDDADMADSFDFIYTHIKNIKKKLTDAGSKDYFQSVYGIGYKFSAL
ncbi:DNA-binding response OmpR family regulator [Pedobacter psychrotolerans]|uniref:DNA-binding response OmpR family regulator n=1 Tax=Pedobacter psychrotolerans TaxID=1843235 RepID=A0A4R2HLT1_9SPHI|nr:response regulator transcription factor [Pedobacter psychrotolerans]TCO31139.1 DNA-binding response OmpR family regulator [Pedobacter psychrotolerans]GGE41952.1 DNA-binding response regulator [Pedobacter psychrotolerans]